MAGRGPQEESAGGSALGQSSGYATAAAAAATHVAALVLPGGKSLARDAPGATSPGAPHVSDTCCSPDQQPACCSRGGVAGGVDAGSGSSGYGINGNGGGGSSRGNGDKGVEAAERLAALLPCCPETEPGLEGGLRQGPAVAPGGWLLAPCAAGPGAAGAQLGPRAEGGGQGLQAAARVRAAAAAKAREALRVGREDICMLT